MGNIFWGVLPTSSTTKYETFQPRLSFTHLKNYPPRIFHKFTDHLSTLQSSGFIYIYMYIYILDWLIIYSSQIYKRSICNTFLILWQQNIDSQLKIHSDLAWISLIFLLKQLNNSTTWRWSCTIACQVVVQVQKSNSLKKFKMPMWSNWKLNSLFILIFLIPLY